MGNSRILKEIPCYIIYLRRFLYIIQPTSFLGHQNLLVRITTQHLTLVMLCLIIVSISGGTYSLIRTTDTISIIVRPTDRYDYNLSSHATCVKFCVLILFAGIYSLKWTSNDRFLRNFSQQFLFYSQSSAIRLLRRKC